MTINTTTGAATLVGHFPGGMEISALAIPYGQAGDPGWISGNVILDGGAGSVESVTITAGTEAIT